MKSPLKNAVEDNFFIKKGYVSRGEPIYFEDSEIENQNITHQPDVYPFAAYLGRRFGCSTIIDIGCGRARKLAPLHPEFRIVGIDFGSNIEYCQSHYSFGAWIPWDIEHGEPLQLDEEVLRNAIIICADVIEHLKNPASLLHNLQKWLEIAPVVLLSTPERDLVRGVEHMGPPPNQSHLREWNESELRQLLVEFGFKIGFLGLTMNNDQNLEKKTLLAVLENPKAFVLKTASDNFKIIAFMSTFNEEDIIADSISRLIKQGIKVYLLDNWSTDATAERAKPFLGHGVIGIEKYPQGGHLDFYDWRGLLRRVEELARKIPADWYIHHDVDEIRESPWPEVNLKDAIYTVDMSGYNCIDHTVIQFEPVDDSFVVGNDIGKHFTHWQFGTNPGHFVQIKAWKNMHRPISLAETGGHNAQFEGRQIFPYKFLLRHYPIRSQLHGNKKIILERIPRFSPEERAMGWHNHYDDIQDGYCFIKDPKKLHLFSAEQFYKEFLIERLSGVGVVRAE
jgi:SAM-dependent methyltransferase